MAIDANVPVVTNQVAADLTTMRNNMKLIVCGEGTAGRVLRVSKLTIADGTAANSIKVKLDSVWNGDSIAEVDNIIKGTTGTYFSLNSSGQYLYLNDAIFSGTAVALLNITHAQTYDYYYIFGRALGGNLSFVLRDISAATVTNEDFTVSITTKDNISYLTYLTSA